MGKYSEYDTTNTISFNFTALEATCDNPTNYRTASPRCDLHS